MGNLVLSAHPEYHEEIEELREQPAHYLFNMFIFKRKVFLDTAVSFYQYFRTRSIE